MKHLAILLTVIAAVGCAKSEPADAAPTGTPASTPGASRVAKPGVATAGKSPAFTLNPNSNPDAIMGSKSK